MEQNTKTLAEKQKTPLKQKLIPLILLVLTIIADQVTKQLVVKNIPQTTFFSNTDEGVIQVIGSFLQFIHVRNNAVAFSIGSTLSQSWRTVLFSFAPLILIIAVCVVYFRSNDFTKLQRWALCGIMGGGIGNLIDRFFRDQGVVDFIDVYFPIYFESKRWPTFNVADSVIVVCVALLLISFIVNEVKSRRNKNV
ncbi:MAG: signal peptidase II [Treponema sp.]|nr:signal peptidase II [Treponema sp.]